ncbi:MAG: NAD-dependent epimerase/dehydratase family protein [Desulfotignum sp.]
MLEKKTAGLCTTLFQKNGGEIKAAADDITGRRRSKKTCFLLTGATGFLGIHLTDMLAKEGHTVILPARSWDNTRAGAILKAKGISCPVFIPCAFPV